MQSQYAAITHRAPTCQRRLFCLWRCNSLASSSAMDFKVLLDLSRSRSCKNKNLKGVIDFLMNQSPLATLPAGLHFLWQLDIENVAQFVMDYFIIWMLLIHLVSPRRQCNGHFWIQSNYWMMCNLSSFTVTIAAYPSFLHSLKAPMNAGHLPIDHL